jgi:hypothetical protein
MCIDCGSMTKPSIDRSYCIPYGGYEAESNLTLILTYLLDTTRSDVYVDTPYSENGFLGPIRFGNKIFYVSPIVPFELISSIYEYEEADNNYVEKGNIFMLEQSTDMEAYASIYNKRIKKVVATRIQSIDIPDYELGSLHISYISGEMCTADNTKAFSADMTIYCLENDTLILPEIVENVENIDLCHFSFVWYSRNVCRICRQNQTYSIKVNCLLRENVVIM